MRTTLLIPKNFDPQKLINDHYQGMPTNGVSIYTLAYICDCIIYTGIIYKEAIFESSRYVPLKSEYLQNIVPNYERSTQLLMQYAVIERDNLYIPSEKCYGYRLCSDYTSEGWVTIPIGGIVKKKLMKKEAQNREQNPYIEIAEQKRQHLFETLKSPLLSIDADGAKRYLKQHYRKEKYQELEYKMWKDFEPDDALDQIAQSVSNFEDQIDKIANNRKFPSNDCTGQRLHSPITNLPKVLRKYLTYDGQPLISLDVKNSQPYFSLLLMQKKFYKKKKGLKKRGLKLYDLNEELYEILTADNTPIMLGKIVEILSRRADPSLKMYIEDAVKGNIYDRFLDMDVNDPNYKDARGDMKTTFFKTLFGPNSNRGKRFHDTYRLPFQVFSIIKSVKTGNEKRKNRRLYPVKKPKPVNYLEDGTAVYEESSWKAYKAKLDDQNSLGRYYYIDEGYSKFATLLQRIESYLLLDVVCYNLAKRIPKIPLVTVHDSIATTEPYIEIVEEEVRSCLTKYVGFPPALVREPWVN